MKRLLCAILLLAFGPAGHGQVFDTHLHGWSENNYRQRGPHTPATAAEYLEQTIASMDRHDIRHAVLSGTVEALAMWTAADPRFIPGYQITGSKIIPPAEFERHVKAGRIKVLGEFAPVFVGRTPADPLYAPYLEIAQEHGVPLAFHAGGLPPMAPLTCCPEARLSLTNPLLIEDVLVRYPRLKVYLQHAGETYYREALSLMMTYPQVYADLGVVLWANDLTRANAAEFLRLAKAAGILGRVMFGSDPNFGPESAIGPSVEYLNSLSFLSEEEKRGVFYDNALRFFGLEGQN